MDPLRPLSSEDAIREALDQEWAVLYKHSDRCWVSAMAVRQVRRFAESHPDTPVYQVNVIGGREASHALARMTGIPHQSPQAIVVNEGRVVWHDSHFGVKAAALAQARGVA